MQFTVLKQSYSTAEEIYLRIKICSRLVVSSAPSAYEVCLSYLSRAEIFYEQ